MNRNHVEDVLLKMGTPANLKGFAYVVDAIEVLFESGADIGITKELYPRIAKKNSTTPTRVERAIRQALLVVRNRKADRETIEHYIGFENCTNANSLKQLYMMLKREEVGS